MDDILDILCPGILQLPLQSVFLWDDDDDEPHQGTSEEAIEKNPGAFVNPSQVSNICQSIPGNKYLSIHPRYQITKQGST